MPQPVERVERRLPVPAQIRGRARAIHDERVWHVVFGWIERVRGGVEAHVGQAAALELREERLEPFWVFVVDGDRLHGYPGEGSRAKRLSRCSFLTRIKR